MNQSTLIALLAEVQRGTLTPEQASARLSNLPFERPSATPRSTTTAACAPDCPRSSSPLARRLRKAPRSSPAWPRPASTSSATHADNATAEAVLAAVPASQYNQTARTLTLRQSAPKDPLGNVVILCGRDK